jgi:hypothetical protein
MVVEELKHARVANANLHYTDKDEMAYYSGKAKALRDLLKFIDKGIRPRRPRA